jgi:hypothetical protein
VEEEEGEAKVVAKVAVIHAVAVVATGEIRDNKEERIKSGSNVTTETYQVQKNAKRPC